MNKYYGLTQKPNGGGEDKAPSWMDSLFEKKAETNTEKKDHPFSGIKDPILNPESKGVSKKDKKCKNCGKPLANNQVGFCSSCSGK
jgi:hypothetical protein